MKKNNALSVYLSLFFMLGVLLLFSYVHTFAEKELPDIVELRKSNKESTGITVSDIEIIKKSMNLPKITFYKELPHEYIDDIPVKPVAVSENFFDVMGRTILYGSDITPEMISNSSSYAIIGETLCQTLFLDKDILGERIEINEISYEIVGIYEESDAFLSRVQSDLYHRVYVPYTSIENISMTVDSILIPQNENELEVLLGIVQGSQNYANYTNVDYRQYADFINQWSVILKLALSVSMIMMLVGIVWEYVKRLYLYVRIKAESEYFIEVIKHEKSYIIKKISVVIMLSLMAVLLLYRYAFVPILPVEYTPADNIFDIGFYKDAFVKQAQAVNSAEFLGDGYFVRVYRSLFQIEFFMTMILSMAIILLGILWKKLYRNNKYQSYELIVWGGIICAAMHFGGGAFPEASKILILILLSFIVWIMKRNLLNTLRQVDK